MTRLLFMRLRGRAEDDEDYEDYTEGMPWPGKSVIFHGPDAIVF